MSPIEIPCDPPEGQKGTNWLSIFLPTGIAIVIQIGTALYYFGGISSRLGAVEEKQHAYEVDHVSRHDLEERDSAGETYRQELNIRLNRMDDKLDQILVNQSLREK